MDELDSIMIGSDTAVEQISKCVYGATANWHNITNPEDQVVTDWKQTSEEHKENVRRAVRHGLTQRTNKPWKLHDVMAEPVKDKLMTWEQLDESRRVGFAIMAGVIDAINQYLILRAED